MVEEEVPFHLHSMFFQCHLAVDPKYCNLCGTLPLVFFLIETHRNDPSAVRIIQVPQNLKNGKFYVVQ
jgi:hypothetical protein